MQPVSPRSALQEMFVPSLSPHQQGTKTYSFKSRGRGQVKTWGGCSISWDTHSEAAGQRIEQENWEGDGDKQESKIHSLWSNIRTQWEVLAETDMSSITTSSKLSILVEGVLVLVSGFFFWFLRTQQWFPLCIPDSSLFHWPPHAFPILAPSLKISTPSAVPSPNYVLPLNWYRRAHSQALWPQGCSTAFYQEKQGSTELLLNFLL